MSTIRLLSDEDVKRLVPLDSTIDLIEAAFRADARGRSEAFPVVRTAIEEHRGIFGIKSGRLLDSGTLGLKAGGYWRENPALRELGAHQSTIVLFDPETGRPEALLRANYITEARTGAAGAVAASALANPDASTVAVVGAGRQARVQIECLAKRFSLAEVFIFARRPEAAQQIEAEFNGAPFRVRVAKTPEEAISGADIIVTTTPSFEPVLADDWVTPGAHINAMGSDTRGKGELDPQLLGRARFFADNVEQSRTLGEAQRLAAECSICGTLGAVLTGENEGRLQRDDITVFDSTGVTFQDLAMARQALDRARETGAGAEVAF
ncbi:MAG: ornithine cyclodeaminase family protein [Trueperaceae bacterium]